MARSAAPFVNLEDHLRTPLFSRAVRAVKLTATGQAYAGAVRDALERLASATAAVADQSSGVVNVSTLDSFASKWLIPRLFRFREAHEDIDVRLSTSDRLADFVTDGIDIAIRYGRGQYPGIMSELLMREDVFPVSSPKLLEGEHPLKTPADLKHHVLIHDEFQVDWTMWLRVAGVKESIRIAVRVSIRRFTRCRRRCRATAWYSGAARSSATICARGVSSSPSISAFPADLAYYVAYQPRALEREKVKAFRDWLFDEVKRVQ